jgi:hypothetical protein
MSPDTTRVFSRSLDASVLENTIFSARFIPAATFTRPKTRMLFRASGAGWSRI